MSVADIAQAAKAWPFEQARELYGDLWRGFAESDLHHWVEEAGSKKIEINVVAREDEEPHFETILAGAEK